MKSPVAGVAGSVRIDQLTMADLTFAERHGKRLDETGKSRAINDAPPLTTSGLELKALYEAHVEGAFLPKAHYKAMHILIQFPKDLVDGEDPANMLHHAREFTRRIFGNAAIFADRVDRDEKSRHVVDVFVAPKYLKKTKHTAKTAVTMSNHLKTLATSYGYKNTTPRETGRALQDAFLQYLREDMGLTEAQRGSAKLIPGNDHKNAEELRAEELEQQEAVVESRERNVDVQDKMLAAARDDIAQREATLAEREAQNSDGARRIAEKLAEVEADQLEIDAARAAIAADLAEAERTRRDAANTAKIASNEADRLAAEHRQAAAAAEAARDVAVQYAAKAKKEVDEAKLERARIAETSAALAQERLEIEQKRELHERQLALLERAANEDSSLRLRAGRHLTDDRGFVMDEDPMTPREWSSYLAPWHPMIAAVARRLARALDAVRKLTASFLDREITVAAREAALVTKEAEADRELIIRRDTQRAEHQAAMAELDAQRAGLDLVQAEATRLMENAIAREVTATSREKEADDVVMSHANWAATLKAIGETPDLITINSQGHASIDTAVARTLGPAFTATFQKPPPEWAGQALGAQLELAEKTYSANLLARQAENAQDRLERLIAEAGPVMTPVQEAFASRARHVARSVSPWQGNDNNER